MRLLFLLLLIGSAFAATVVTEAGTNTAELSWTTNAACRAEITYAETSKKEPATRENHYFKLYALSPDTEYRYKITCGDTAAIEDAFRTMPAKPELEAFGMYVTPEIPLTGYRAVANARIRNAGTSTANDIRVEIRIVERAYLDDKEIDLDTLLAISGTEQATRARLEGPVIHDKALDYITKNTNRTIQQYFLVPEDVDSIVLATTVDPEDTIDELYEEGSRLIERIPVRLLKRDVYVTNISISDSRPNPGERASVKITAANRGTLWARDIPTYLYASINGGDETQIGVKNITYIGAGKEGYAFVSWDIPEDTRTLSLTARTEAKSDADQDNDLLTSDIRVYLPDLTIEPESLKYTVTKGASQTSIAAGDTVRLTATVKNIGDYRGYGTNTKFYYLDNTGKERLIDSSATSLSENRSVELTATWKVPQDISPSQVIMVKTDPELRLTEHEEGNNAASMSVTARLPDLTPTITVLSPGTIPTIASARGRVWLRLTVQNAGTQTSAATNASMNGPTGSPGVFQVPVLAPGQSTAFEYSYTLTSDDPTGAYAFHAEVGPQNELDTENNAADEVTQVSENRPPTAVVTASKEQALKREWVEFSCAGSSDPEYGSRGLSCGWEFDYSRNDEGATVMTQFMESGEHLVGLTVTDSLGATNSTTMIINVLPNQAPLMTVEDQTVYKDTDSTIIAACGDSDGDVVQTTWSFGDGTSGAMPGCSASHTYTSVGTYTATATATDDSGATTTDTALITVVNPPEMVTNTYEKVYIGHYYYPQVGNSWGPKAETVYGFYKILYEASYTVEDSTIHRIKYTVLVGPQSTTVVSDNDPETYFLPVGAGVAIGATSLQIDRIGVWQGATSLWSIGGGPFVTAADAPVTREYSGLNIPFDPQGGVFFTIDSTIENPSQMCTAEGYNCQKQLAVWNILED